MIYTERLQDEIENTTVSETLEVEVPDRVVDGDPDESPAPIDVDATAELDYASDPERPLSIELEIPAGVVDEDELDDVLETVSIDARIADE